MQPLKLYGEDTTKTRCQRMGKILLKIIFLYNENFRMIILEITEIKK